MTDNPTADVSPGRFRSLTGLSDKALRLYAERGILVPASIDDGTGYRSYALAQLRDGITLDLLRRARIPLEDLVVDDRFRFDEHRGKLAMRRAMEDFSLDLAERVATGDPSDLVADVTEADPAHWIAADVPFSVSSSPDDLEETFTAMAVDLPQLDGVLVEALRAEGIETIDESWTASVPGAVTRLRLAHRVEEPVSPEKLVAIEEAVMSRTDDAVRVMWGTLPERREVVYSWPKDTPTDDVGLADTTLSYLAAIAFAYRVADGDVTALNDTARRRVPATSLFDQSVSPEDVYDIAF
ncbi:MerR family transcriptional regulator [Labedella endophytica]|uniref:MerR family transcriptional regulator n=1 Tax=Labedella endophytica TaxID=1523160 RepID=A0A3S0X7K4_9MICO|nr:MerR family transcriptional regulator [Labedella endophytica]RUR01183.1 MerR family transcriptional regulator [Labedella endophytica]